MIKKRYIKKAYIEEAYCDKCGAKMEFSGIVLSSWPEQYPYICSNSNCDGRQTFHSYDRPGKVHYEFEDENV